MIRSYAVEGKLCEDDFNYAMQDVKAQIDVQHAVINDLKFETYDYETALNYGEAILENTLQYWRTADSVQKQKFQLLIFPQGIACDKNGIVGTPVLSPLYAVLAASTASESLLVVPRGVEPLLPG